MSTIFTKIIKGEIPCHKILEDENYLAFLDIRPVKTGHTLVIPKKEIDYVFDVDDETLAGLIIFSKKVAKMIEKVVPCQKVGVMIAGLEVRHCHIHLIPIDRLSDMNFANAKTVDQNELLDTARKIINGK